MARYTAYGYTSGTSQTVLAFALIYFPKYVFDNGVAKFLSELFNVKKVPSGISTDLVPIVAVFLLCLGVIHILSAAASSNATPQAVGQTAQDMFYVRSCAALSFLALTFTPNGSAFTVILMFHEGIFLLWLYFITTTFTGKRKSKAKSR